MVKHLLFLMLTAAVGLLPLCAAEMIVAEAGKKSPFSIVYSTSIQQEAGKLLQQQIKAAAGVELPLLYISKHSGSPAIFIERIPESKANWEYRIFAEKGNIHLQSRDENKELSGSLKAVISFLEHTTAFTAFAPGEKGYRTPPQKKIVFDDTRKLHYIPHFGFNTTASIRRAGAVYDVANNMLPAPWFSHGGGHTHWIAFPKKIYETHPEYFALIGKKRMAPHALNWHSQYCYSHPDVEERIFQETRRRLSQKGIYMVEAGQNDGFRPCECDKCRKTDINARLWAINLRIAERMLKACPGKKINFIAYGPTLKAPKGVKEFPPNAMVQLAPCNADVLADWSKVKVPAGFSAYLYNWGWYQYEGFMPKLSISDLKKQIQTALKSNIKGFYRCGFGDLYGLEGYAYFIWGKLQENPEADTGALLKRYCQAAYGESAPVMEELFLFLDKRLELNIPRKDEWYNHELLDGKKAPLIETSRLHVMRYPAGVRKKMGELLTKAEKTTPGNELIKLARIEFDYLCLTVELSFIFDELRQKPSQALWEKLLAAMDKRKAFIDKLPVVTVRNEVQVAPLGALPLFGGAPVAHLHTGGRLKGQLRAPLNWDTSYWRKAGFMPFKRTIFNDGKAHKLVQRHFYSPDPRVDKEPVFVTVTSKGKSLNVAFNTPAITGKKLAGSEFYIFFGDGKERFRLAGKVWQRKMLLYKRTLTNLQNGGKGDVYTLVPGKSFPIQIKKAGVSVTVTPETLGLSGNKLEFNASCFSPFGYTFEYNLDQKNNANCNDTCGELIIK